MAIETPTRSGVDPAAQRAAASQLPAPFAARRALLVLFAVALALRLFAVFALDTPGDARGESAWKWGGESACLAQSLADGRGYGDPWCKGTGPSSWLTPPYPALVAVLMRSFGGVNPRTAAALFVLQALASAATCLVIVRLGERLAWPRAGLLAGWLWALYPVAIWNAAAVVWDTTFAALGVSLVLLLLLRAPETLRATALAGLSYGALLLLNPAPLVLAPAALGFLALASRGAAAAARACAVFTAASLAVCLPWIVRNQIVLGTAQLRPNFGVELRMGNNDTANGRPVPFRYHPSHVDEELDLYRRLGEADYARDNTRRALSWIASNPGRFLELSLRRTQIFWLGELPSRDPRRTDHLAPGRDPRSWLKFGAFLATGAGALLALLLLDLRGSQRWLVTSAVCLYGLPYFVTHVSERYRFPIDPLVVLLDAWLALWVLRRLRPREANA
jgi:hypothetical protein